MGGDIILTEQINASDAMLGVLEDWGIDHIYGYPGGSFDSTMNALYNESHRLKFIQVRHEEAGALAAAADAKLTGKIGVTFGSAGPGAVHLLNGLYDAKTDHVPVLAIVAQVPTANMNIDFFQAINEQPIFDDVAVWNRTATTAQSIPKVIDEAIRQAYKYHGVAVVTLPKDLGWTPIDNINYSNAANYQELEYPAPTQAKVEKAYQLIKKAKAPIIYFGLGAKQAGKELKEISAKFKIPLVSSFLAKGIVEETNPAYLGSAGRVGTKPANDVGFQTDLILWVGNNVPFSLFLFNPQATVIQIDIDNEKLGKRHHVDLPILADAQKSLRALLDYGQELEATSFYQAVLADKKNWKEWQQSFSEDEQVPLRPEPLFKVLNDTVSQQAIFTLDVGNVDIDFERLANTLPTQKWVTSGKYATMGFSLPAALSAKLNYPHREVYSLVGDGGFAMMMEEIMTAVKYGLQITTIIFSNETLGFIEAEQTDDSHQPLFGVDLPETNWAATANGMGAKGYTVHTLNEFKEALAAAKKTAQPTVIDVKITHEMPFTTQHMNLNEHKQGQEKVQTFKEKYQTKDLQPFEFFLEKYGVFEKNTLADNQEHQQPLDTFTSPSKQPNGQIDTHQSE